MKQVDIGMTLKERILEYLDAEDGYRSCSQIAKAVGSSSDEVRKACADMYWDVGNKAKLTRMVNRDTPNGQQQIVYRA